MRGLQRSGRAHPWRTELDAMAKAIGGSMLFGVPLLFTMEMWWIGESIPRPQLLVFLAAAFAANVVLARMSGFRDDRGSVRSDLGQAAEAMAIGIVSSVAVLACLGRIGLDTPLPALVGTIAVQVVPLSLGAMVANLVFDPSVGRSTDGSTVEGDSPARELGNDILATIAGAMFLGFAIAPTEEMPMLAVALGTWNLIGVVVLSLFAGYVIVFASGFDPAHRSKRVGGLFQDPFSETILAYTISLACTAGLLVGFGHITLDDPLASSLAKVIVLGVPASIGGAAGRVVV